MKYFLDTEFIEVPYTIDLISIGIICEDGRELYLESNEVDWSRANQWVLDNVVTKLNGQSVSRAVIKEEILKFIDPKPSFYGYFSDYDWVVFCWIFGSMIDLPKGWPMYCNDLKQIMDQKGITKEMLAVPETDEHNALDDAKWNKKAYDRIIQIGKYGV